MSFIKVKYQPIGRQVCLTMPSQASQLKQAWIVLEVKQPVRLGCSLK